MGARIMIHGAEKEKKDVQNSSWRNHNQSLVGSI
jgi:hypothetical protein